MLFTDFRKLLRNAALLLVVFWKCLTEAEVKKNFILEPFFYLKFFLALS